MKHVTMFSEAGDSGFEGLSRAWRVSLPQGSANSQVSYSTLLMRGGIALSPSGLDVWVFWSPAHCGTVIVVAGKVSELLITGLLFAKILVHLFDLFVASKM